MKTGTFRYTQGFRRLLDYAAFDCADRGEREVRVDHLLLGLYREDFPLIDDVLANFRVDSMVVLDRLLKANPSRGVRVAVSEVELSPQAMQAVAKGETEAERAGDGFLTAAHVFLGILHHRRRNIQDFFIREEFAKHSRQVLSQVRELVRWLRIEQGAQQHNRELEILEDGTLVALDAMRINGSQKTSSGRRTLAIHIKMIKHFSVRHE